MDAELLREKIRQILRQETPGELQELEALRKHPDFLKVFETVCSEVEMAQEQSLQRLEPLLGIRPNPSQEQLPYAQENEDNPEIPSLEEITSYLAGNKPVAPEIKGIAQKVQEHLFPERLPGSLEELSAAEIQSYMEGTISPRLEKIFQETPALQQQLEFFKNPEEAKKKAVEVSPFLEEQIMARLRKKKSVPATVAEPASQPGVIEQLMDAVGKPVSQAVKDWLPHPSWEIFNPFGGRMVYGLCGTTSSEEAIWYRLGVERLTDKLVVELLHDAEFSQLKVLVYNVQDTEHLPEIKVKLSVGKPVDRDIEPFSGCPTAGTQLFELAPPLKSDAPTNIRISFTSQRFHREFSYPYTVQPVPQVTFELLKIYGSCAHWNHTVFYAVYFWQAVNRFLRHSPYHQIYRLCEEAATYLLTALDKTSHIDTHDWEALKDVLQQSRKLLQQKTDTPILEKLDGIIGKLQTPAPRPTLTDRHPGKVCALFYSEDIAENAPKAKKPYGFVWYLRVEKRTTQTSFCGKCCQEENFREALEDSFEVVLAYLKKYGLTRVFAQQNFYVDVGRDESCRGCTFHFQDRSIGLAAVLAYFSCILKVAYPDTPSPFDIPPGLAATGKIRKEDGGIDHIAGSPAKILALWKDYPKATAYVPKVKQTLDDLQNAGIFSPAIIPVENIEEMFCHLFANGNREEYDKKLAEAIQRLKANHDLDKVVMYWTIPTTAGFTKDFAALFSILDQNPPADVMAIQYLKDNMPSVANYRERRQKSAQEIRKEAWEEGKFSPTLLECYASLENLRLEARFKRQRHLLRLELDPQQSPVMLHIPENSKEDVKANITMFHDSPKRILLTLTGEGTVLVTLEIELNRPSLDALCWYSQTTFRHGLCEAVNQILKKQTFLDSPEKPEESEPYLFLVVRETADFKTKGNDVIEADIPLFHSLLTGFKRETVAPQQHAWLLGQNQSTREDTFMAITKRQALLVEARGRRENLTRKNIYSQATEELIRSREQYNDINYLVWLEILLSLRKVVSAPGASQASVADFYRNIYGDLVTQYVPYQLWLDLWKTVLGITHQYEALPPHG